MPLSFDRDFDPRYGEAVEVAPGVRRVTARNPGPFTFKGTNTFLIGQGELAVLDPGPDDSFHLDALVAAIGRTPVRQIIVSHRHRDHTAGLAGLRQRIEAPVLAAAIQRPDLAQDGQRLDAPPDLSLVADRVIEGGALIEGDGYRLETIATPGHASDHLAFALGGTNIVLSGDHVMGWATSVVAPPDGSMRDYMASLERLLSRSEDLYLPAHGGGIANARSYVRGLRSHRKMRERAIIERLARGDRTIPEMVKRIYSDVDPRLHGAASLSTLAHLIDLADRGVVEREGTSPLEATYSLAGSPSASGSEGAAADVASTRFSDS